ncbi:MAG TPA: hypothetical protein VKR56_06780 [Candidatus Cybelea sp.]|nr:hypothetical protein [Candidatus Cybelea sp.]
MGVLVAACMTAAALGGYSVALQDAVNGVIPGPPTFYQWVLPLDYDGWVVDVERPRVAPARRCIIGESQQRAELCRYAGVLHRCSAGIPD